MLVQVLAQQILQLVQRLQPNALGELFIDRGFDLSLDGLHLDVEGGEFAGQIGRLIVGREGDFDRFLVADLGALQLLFEAGDEAVRTDHQVGVFGGPAVESHAVQLAEVVNGDLVAVGGLHGLALLVLVGLGLAGQFLQRLVQILVGGLVDGTVQLQGLGIDRSEVGHDFQGHFEGQVVGTGQDLVHVRGQFHVGGSGRAHLDLFKGGLARLVDGVIDDLAHHVATEGLLDV